MLRPPGRHGGEGGGVPRHGAQGVCWSWVLEPAPASGLGGLRGGGGWGGVWGGEGRPPPGVLRGAWATAGKARASGVGSKHLSSPPSSPARLVEGAHEAERGRDLACQCGARGGIPQLQGREGQAGGRLQLVPGQPLVQQLVAAEAGRLAGAALDRAQPRGLPPRKVSPAIRRLLPRPALLLAQGLAAGQVRARGQQLLGFLRAGGQRRGAGVQGSVRVQGRGTAARVGVSGAVQ